MFNVRLADSVNSMSGVWKGKIRIHSVRGGSRMISDGGSI